MKNLKNVDFRGNWTVEEKQWIIQSKETLPVFVTVNHEFIFRKLENSPGSKKVNQKRSIDNKETTVEIQKSSSKEYIFYFKSNFTNRTQFKKDLQRASIRAFWWTLDDEEKISITLTWRSINQWKNAFSSMFALKEHAQNKFSAGYTEQGAMQNSKQELLFFASHYFIPKHEFEKKPNRSLRCTLLAQSDFLEDYIHSKEPSFKSAMEKAIPRCSDFEKWANLDEIRHFELVMSAPSTVFVGSLFGHVFLRIVQESPTGIEPIMSSRGFGFMAQTHGPIESDSFYNIKGIFGFYRAKLFEKPFGEYYRQYVVMEDRDMKRWKINLSDKQKRRLMIRIWTVLNTSSYTYYFFTHNCGTFLVDLINGVLPSHNQIMYPESNVSLPSGTLDGYIHTKNDGNSLVEFIPERYESLRSELIVASKLRRDYMTKILSAQKSEPDMQKELQLVWMDMKSKSDKKRRTSYSRLYDLYNRRKDLINEDVYRVLWYSAVIENYFSNRKNIESEKIVNRERIKKIRVALKEKRKEVEDSYVTLLTETNSYYNRDDKRSKQVKGNKKNKDTNNRKTGKEQKELKSVMRLLFSGNFDRRMQGYKQINRMVNTQLLPMKQKASGDANITAKWDNMLDLIRQTILLRAYDKYDSALLTSEDVVSQLLIVDKTKNLYEQGYIDEIRHLLEYEYVSHVPPVILEIQKYRSQIKKEITDIETKKLKQVLVFKRELFQKDEVLKDYNATYSHTGIDMFMVQQGYMQSNINSVFALVYTTAMLEEVLGDHRVIGFPYYAEMSVLKTQLFVPYQTNFYEKISLNTTIFSYRLMKPKVAEERFLPVDTGIHIGFYWEHDRLLEEPLNLFKAQVGGIISVFNRGRYSLHNFFEVNAEVRNYFPGDLIDTTQDSLLLYGLPVSMSLRIPLGTMHRSMDYIQLKSAYGKYFSDLSGSFDQEEWKFDIDLSFVLTENFSLSARAVKKGVRFFMNFSYVGLNNAYGSRTGYGGTGTPRQKLLPEYSERVTISLGVRFN